MPEPIHVSRPFLPPLEEVLPALQQIWSTRVLSNNGPFHAAFEARLADYLGVEHLSVTTNGMLALTTAIEAAELSGEVITTPYSFVATTHAVRREQLTPVFVDVKPDDLNIDPAKVEAAITPRTSAIVAVHCYGNPCDVDALADIARRHNLRVIYDAAHAFGVRYRGRSLLSHGDFSALSFHATKAFNTFEGGAVVAGSTAGKQAVNSLRNFGIADEVTIPAVGTNAKMSEFNAAIGLLQLDHFEHVRKERARVDGFYRDWLSGCDGLDCVPIPEGVEPNYSYFPVLVRPDFRLSRDGLYEALKAQGINSRRYFYPLLSSLPMYADMPSAARDNLPVASLAAEQILCLPIYPDLSEADQQRIVAAIAASGR